MYSSQLNKMTQMIFYIPNCIPVYMYIFTMHLIVCNYDWSKLDNNINKNQDLGVCINKKYNMTFIVKNYWINIKKI